MSAHVTVMFFNSGRAKTAATVRAAMRRLRNHAHAAGGPVVLALVEIDEADRTEPSDHALIRQLFKLTDGWRKTWMSTTNPILSLNLRPKRKLGNLVKACAGLVKLTPARSIKSSVYPMTEGPDLAVVHTHFPAGAYNGHRRAAQRTALRARYAQVQDKLDAVVAAHQRAGRHVVQTADRNGPYTPTRRREVMAIKHGPDSITVTPAAGWTVKAKGSTFPQPIETFHRGLMAKLTFTKAGG